MVELPDTVQALLAARLDSLEPEERRLVQHAAVVGRTFWEGSLASVTGSEDELRRSLLRLQEKDIVVPDATMRIAGEREYAFRHVLIRDVAYGMLPRAVRCAKHYEVGLFIEDRAGERTDEVVTLLAEHYGRAATLAGEADIDAGRVRGDHGQGRAVPGVGRGRGGVALLQPGVLRALQVGPRPVRRSRRRHGRARHREAG